MAYIGLQQKTVATSTQLFRVMVFIQMVQRYWLLTLHQLLPLRPMEKFKFRLQSHKRNCNVVQNNRTFGSYFRINTTIR
jgi:hypothetical protein